ncbi:MAG: 50S ribosomal protein L21, partial [Candidatus Eremiobacteraeota bacterium]|nr:50S ribosomal protein L21 [Candidatus Eremiobacteraeota bacterium]
MYAIIETGGKQLKVAEGDVIRCDMLESQAGSNVTFERVVMASSGKADGVRIGSPLLTGATVVGTVLR